MATGTGKTFTAITSAQRLAKFAHAKRIPLSRRYLRRTGRTRSDDHGLNDDNRKFTEL
jgi:type I restriction enzyme, R subunit